ncbi:MAG: YdcF family protein [Treponema sp.]|nr:YdcF family protein [Treponema sp.]
MKQTTGSKFSIKPFFSTRNIRAFFVVAGGTLLATLIINMGMIVAARNFIYRDINEIPYRSVVLVLGASVHGTTLSPVLRDRVQAGTRLMENGKGGKLLLSGDHGQIHYNEVDAMRLYVLANAPAIPHEDIFLDHAGFSTWDSMYRARDVFEVRDLIIVTQEFHISRAVIMARRLGMDAVGYAVNQDHFSRGTQQFWRFREYFARVRAFFSIVFKPPPRFLGETIPISGDGRVTWD